MSILKSVILFLKKKIFTWILKITLTITLLLLAFNKIEWNSLVIEFNKINFKIIILLILTYIFQTALVVEIFIKLFNFLNLNRPNRFQILKHNFISSLYLFAIPGVAAPDVYLSSYYIKFTKNYKKVLLAIFINRFSGLMIFFIASSFTFFIMIDNLKKFININWNIYYIVIFSIVLFLMFIIAAFIFRKKIINFLNSKNHFLSEYFTKISKLKSCQLIPVFIAKLAWFFISVGSRVLLAKIIGLNILVLELVGVIIIVNLLIAMPISLNGIGIREFGFVGLLGLFNVPEAQALLLSFLDFGITLIGAFIGSIFLISDNVIGLANFKKNKTRNQLTPN